MSDHHPPTPTEEASSMPGSRWLWLGAGWGRGRAVWAAHRWVRVATLMGLAGIINLFSWPLGGVVAGSVGLDPSWQIALHMAADQGLDFGREIGFTYGPLGFLVVPQAVAGSTALWSFAFVGVIRWLLVLAVLVAARRAFGHLAIGVVVAWVVAAMLWEVTELAGLLVLFAALLLIQQPAVGRFARIIPSGLGAVAGVLLLVKLNVGITALVGFAVAAWFHAPGRWRSLAAFAGSLGVVGLVLWLATGNSLGDLPRWVAWSWQVTSGYAGGVMSEDVTVDRSWEYPAYLLLAAALVGAAAWSLRRGRPRAQAIGAMAVLVFGLWTGFKHGFVRHDPHVIFSFVALAALPAAIRWRGHAARITGAVLVVVGAGVAIRSWGADAASVLDPFAGRSARAVDQLAQVAGDSKRGEAIEAGKSALRGQLAIDPSLIDAIGREAVHVAPHETSAAWAYGLTWRPIPHFQSFSTWTRDLDRANWRFLLGPDAPRYVLRQDIARFDYHSPVWESPAENLALVCRYTQRAIVGTWELLERGSNRCGTPRLLVTVTARAGTPLQVPVSAPNEIVYMHMDIASGAWARGRELLFKPARQPQVRLPGIRATYAFRIPRRLLDAPLLLRAPRGFVAPFRIARLLATESVLLEAPASARVSFFAVPTGP